MSTLFNIYCDESCHLESSQITAQNRFMVLGGVSCPDDKKAEIFHRIKAIKKEGGLKFDVEFKWIKVSNSQLDTYKNLLHYFFDCDALAFRAVVIDKMILDHKTHNQTHDEFYYKTYWQVLEWFVEPSNRYHIYLDIKDTQGVYKIKKLQDVLCRSHHDYNRAVIERIQEVRSHEIAIMQLTDLLIGAVSYANRYPEGGKSKAKQELVSLIKERSQLTLQSSTSLGARKLNIFHWQGQ